MRKIAIKTNTECRFYEIPSDDKPLTIVQEKLYRTDTDYMLARLDDGSEFCLYNLNGIVPLGIENPPDPDKTMAYCDVERTKSKVASKAKRPRWFNTNTIVYIAIGIVIVYYLINHYLL